jgi:hypothetical protein
MEDEFSRLKRNPLQHVADKTETRNNRKSRPDTYFEGAHFGKAARRACRRGNSAGLLQELGSTDDEVNLSAGTKISFCL